MTTRRSPIALRDAHAFPRLIEAVPGEFQPVVRPARRTQTALLGELPALSPEYASDRSYAAQPRVVDAELFVHGNELIALSLYRDLRRTITDAGGKRQQMIGWEVRIIRFGSDFDTTSLDRVQGVVEDCGIDLDFSSLRLRSARFNDLLEEGRQNPPEPTASETTSAELLRDGPTRRLAISIKSSGGLLVTDASRQLAQQDKSRVSDILAALQADELIATEIVIVCKRVGTQVARVPTADVIADMDRKGVHCSCGALMSEERAEEALSVTTKGAGLLDGSRWFTVVLINELMGMNVPITDILVDQESGGDEMDCIAVVSGDMILFELKDKQFDLRNAYSFGAKIGLIRPDLSVIVTTDKVGTDV